MATPLHHHHHLGCCPQSNMYRKDAPRGFRSEFLQEAEHQVSQRGAQRLVVVADDVRPVLLQLNEGVLRLQVQDVSVCRLLHLHLCDTVLRGNRWITIIGAKSEKVSVNFRKNACRCCPLLVENLHFLKIYFQS